MTASILEITDESFNPATAPAVDPGQFDIDLPCQGCGGDGRIRWDDGIDGPCVVCQAEDSLR